MPAKNTGTANVSLGTTHNSKFKQAAASTPGAKKGVSMGTKTASKANLPANNTNNTSYTLGNTKHSAGGSPSYMNNKG